MKKILLEKFIKKYSLGGAIESVNIESTGKIIEVNAMPADQNVAVSISLKLDEFEKGIYPVYDTKILQNLLGVLGTDISITAKKHAGKNMSLQFTDDSTLVTIALADVNAIEKGTRIKTVPDFENVFEIDSKFIEKFINAKAALSDLKAFTFVSDGTTSEIVLGHSTLNTNRISIKVNATILEKIEPIQFHAKYMKELLYANKEAASGNIEIAAAGMARISFKIDEFDITYFLFKMNSEY